MFKILKQCFNLLNKEQKKQIFFLQVLIIITTLVEIGSIFAVGAFISALGNLNIFLKTGTGFFFDLYNYINFKNQREFLIFLSASVLFIFFISSLFSILTTHQLAMYGSKIGLDLSIRLYKYYLQKSWIFHTTHNSNHLINKIAQETQRVTNGIITQAMYMNAKVILVVFTFLAILIYNPFIAITGFGIFTFCYWALYSFLKKKINKSGEELTKEQELRFKLMGEGFGGIKDLLLTKRQNFFTNLFKKSSDKYAYHSGNIQVLSLIPRYVLEFLTLSSVILLVIYLLNFSQIDLNSNEILPLLAVYGFAGFKTLPAFQQIYYNLSSIKGNISAFNSIREDLFESLKNNEKYEIKNKNVDLDLNKKAHNEIEISKSFLLLKDISFSYPGLSYPSVSNINIKIEKNSIIGFVGPSGSGKSTIIDILLGLLKPSSGRIFFNEKEMNDQSIIEWQSKCALVSQNIFLADATIKENIAFGIPGDLIDNDKISYASKVSQIDEFTDIFPLKLDTKVGERGVQLSGGQRQRIGIARALYNDAEVLIFDEATNSLDLITEKLIMNAIHQFTGIKTIIIITHRLETVKKCNYIYLVEKGKVISKGNYETLSKNSKLFQEIK
jgi:ABC-type multidrug transport system fused ATPase/permease subunit